MGLLKWETEGKPPFVGVPYVGHKSQSTNETTGAFGLGGGHRRLWQPLEAQRDALPVASFAGASDQLEMDTSSLKESMEHAM